MMIPSRVIQKPVLEFFKKIQFCNYKVFVSLDNLKTFAIDFGKDFLTFGIF